MYVNVYICQFLDMYLLIYSYIFEASCSCSQARFGDGSEMPFGLLVWSAIYIYIYIYIYAHLNIYYLFLYMYLLMYSYIYKASCSFSQARFGEGSEVPFGLLVWSDIYLHTYIYISVYTYSCMLMYIFVNFLTFIYKCIYTYMRHLDPFYRRDSAMGVRCLSDCLSGRPGWLR